MTTNNLDNSFPKIENLKSTKRIAELFASGKMFKSFPVKAQFMISDQGNQLTQLNAGFVVSKKNFKRAVDRNKFKRLLRESYRLHKHELKSTLHARDLHLDIMFIYITNKEFDYCYIEKKMIKTIQLLEKHILKNHSS